MRRIKHLSLIGAVLLKCNSEYIFYGWSSFHSYVSETERLHVVPSQVQRHIVAGLASVVGGLSIRLFLLVILPQR